MDQNYSDGEQSGQSNGKNIVAKSSNSDKKMDILNTFLSGIWTLERLTKESPADMREKLTLFLQDSHVSHSALQENEPDPMTKEICGPPLSSAYALLDRDTHCWKTSQDSLALGISEPSFETWPKAGMIVDGAAYRRPKWEQTIGETDFGLLWPTPSYGDHPDRTVFNPIKAGKNIRHLNKQGTTSKAYLSQIVKMWPTPQNQGLKECINGKTKPLKMFPTPQGRDWKGKSQRANFQENNRDCLPNVVGGQLNPTWTDWLMGFPIGWTDLRPSVTPKCLSAWLRHFDYFRRDCNG